MNKVILTGYLTKDVEVKGAGDRTVGRSSVAVQRRYKNANGEYEADFPNIVAFGEQANFLEKYFKKGDPIEVVGRIQTGSYDGTNGRVYTTDVVVEEIGFGKTAKTPAAPAAKPTASRQAPAPAPARSAKPATGRVKPAPAPAQDYDDSEPPFDI